MFCTNCGKEVAEQAVACPGCGLPMNESGATGAKSEKSKLVALLLCLFFGVLGVHRFYVGKVGSGIATLLTLGFFGIWPLIDLLIIVCGSFRDAEGKLLK